MIHRNTPQQKENYKRMIKRSHTGMVFWREKLIEIVGNYRAWKKTVLPLDHVDPNYKIIQTRRVKRLVSQAYVEYRRKQSELNLLVELESRTRSPADTLATNLFLRLHSDTKQPVKSSQGGKPV